MNISVYFDDLNYLNELYFTNNSIKKIAKYDLNIFRKLVCLKIDSNEINSIETGAFKNLEMLEFLTLAKNNISYLNKDLFLNLYQLQHLNLSFNFIEFLEDDIFFDLYNLYLLDLSYNKLKIIQNGLFKNQNLLSSIYLNSNEDLILDLNFTNGLVSINSFYISYKTLKKQENKISIFKSINFITERVLDGLIFLRSIDFYLYEKEHDCELILFFLKRNIKINLRTEQDVDYFLDNCYSFIFNRFK